MSRKGTPRSTWHDWEPCLDSEDHVFCKKCGIRVHKITARRGVGACEGNTVKPYTESEAYDLAPEDIRSNLPEIKPFKPSGEDHGICNSCGQPLKEMPFNSRLAMVACPNRRCGLYRQRLRFLEIK